MVNKLTDGQVINRASVHSSGFAQALWNTEQAIALALFAAVLPGCTPSPGPESGTTVNEVANAPNTDLINSFRIRALVFRIYKCLSETPERVTNETYSNHAEQKFSKRLRNDCLEGTTRASRFAADAKRHRHRQ